MKDVKSFFIYATMTGKDCRVANAPRNDKYASFRSNNWAGRRGGNHYYVIASAARQSSPVFAGLPKSLQIKGDDGILRVCLLIRAK